MVSSRKLMNSVFFVMLRSRSSCSPRTTRCMNTSALALAQRRSLIRIRKLWEISISGILTMRKCLRI
ncbi:hypothetical protein Ahy_A01g001146 isoform I [Arachis hypogaea]|uniref:Uncharacterized protein n=1 Tax=Arachis hypogaea TaxID=3818 RepID=A0A445EM96_ARAHY|nr:hypothetical protein Ahy_A01g001146 isoform I [Arachis hypogaea]